MSILQAIILGLVQGLTEFLPVSSSGHLVLFQKLLGITEPTLVFDTFLHLGTLIAVIAVFWKDIIELLKKPLQKLTWLLVVATIPAVIAGVLFKDKIEMIFSSGKTLGVEFLITGLVLLFAENYNRGTKGIRETKYSDALFVGIMQAVAIMPAISRSGLTISGALFRNMDKEFAARFSFLLSIPVILGAAVLQMKDISNISQSGVGIMPLAIGTLVATVAGYLSIRWMLELIKNKKLRYFSYYVFVVGGLIILDQLIFHIFF